MSEILAADDAAGKAPPAESNLPMRKRKKEEDPSAAGDLPTPEAKMPKTDDGATEGDDDLKPLKRAPMSKAREIRLEQNRKAAKESRRRKKNMIEELQRSVIFFSRANSTLKQQNDELTRVLMQAQTQVTAIESGQQPAPAPATAQSEQTQAVAQQPTAAQSDPQQAQAQAVAQQAVYESQGFPSAAARTAAQTMNAGSNASASGTSTPATSTASATNAAGLQTMPPMQTGATMQAMANFQQAAAAAMASAMNAQVPAGASPGQQQAYTDALNAMAMQQAAAAAAGGGQFPFLQQVQFQGMQFPVAVAGQPAAPPVDANQQQQQQPQEEPQAQPQATEPQQG